MALSTNTAVRTAYEAGTYTDQEGVEWRRGMDGWFSDYQGGKMLCYHHVMAEIIAEENPE